jgi:hypothetical protein
MYKLCLSRQHASGHTYMLKPSITRINRLILSISCTVRLSLSIMRINRLILSISCTVRLRLSIMRINRLSLSISRIYISKTDGLY